LPNLHEHFKEYQSIEEKVQKVFHGGNGKYNTLHKQTNALVKIYMGTFSPLFYFNFKLSSSKSNKTANKENSTITVKTITKEMAELGANFKTGLLLLNELKFCSSKFFTSTFQAWADELINEENAYNSRIEMKLKSMSVLLAVLYMHACDSDNYPL
jgi:hypothetical protein